MGAQQRVRREAGHLDFPGVTPSRQKRSREMTAALLQAGADMLRTRSLAELSIEALCGKVGATVGAFYSRFESKEAYFNTLIELAARDGERRLVAMTENAQLKDASLAELCRLLVSGVIGWIRHHEGVLRAALQHDDTRPDKWNTFKGLARATTAGVTPPCSAPWARAGQPPRRAASPSAFRSCWERWSTPSSTIPDRYRFTTARWRIA
jgi:AcrR family transcriptional regulator